MESKKLVGVLLAIALVIGVVSGYGFDNGNNTLLFASIAVGFVVLSVTYHVLEKGQDEEFDDEIGEY